MLIRFKKDCNLFVVTDYNEDEDLVFEEEEEFCAGEQHEIDICGDVCGEIRDDFVDIQFGDGSVAYSVPRDFFEEI